MISAVEAYAQRDDAQQDAAELRKERQKQSKREKQRSAVIAALTLFPDGETSRVIREQAGVSGAVISEQLEELMSDGIVEECDVKKNKRTERGYRLVSAGGTGGISHRVPA